MKQDRFYQRTTRFHVWLLPFVFSLIFVLVLFTFSLTAIRLNPWLLVGLGSFYGFGLFFYFDKLVQRFRKNLAHQNERLEKLESETASVTASKRVNSYSTELFEVSPNPTWVYSEAFQCLFRNAAATRWEDNQQVSFCNLLDYQMHQNDRLTTFDDFFNQSTAKGKAIKLGNNAELVRNSRKLFSIEGSCLSSQLPAALGTESGYILVLATQDTPTPKTDSLALLDHLSEPLLILESSSKGHIIRYANRSARNKFESDSCEHLIGQDFLSMHLNLGSQKDLSTLRKRLAQCQSYRCITQIDSGTENAQEYEMTLSPINLQTKTMMARFFSRQAGTGKVVEAYDTFSSFDTALMDTPLQIHQALKAAKTHGNFISFLNIHIEKPIECLKISSEQSENSQTQIKKKLSKIRRKQDYLIDLGKDRFLLIIEGKDTKSLAHAASCRVATAIIQAFKTPLQFEKYKWRFKCYIGGSLYQEPQSSLPIVLKETRLAASKAYKAGESHFISFDPSHKAAPGHQEISLKTITRAIEQDELALFLQPVFHIKTHQCEHFEAWLRWEHPNEGLLEPKDFLAEVADAPEMRSLDQWVLKKALALQKYFQTPFSTPIAIAVKLSLQSFFQKDFSEQLLKLAEEEGASLKYLILQVEEHLLVAQATQVLEHLWALKSLGVKVHITQAGTDILARNLIQPDAVDAIELHPALMRMNSQLDENALWLLPFVQQYQNRGIDVIATGVESDSALKFAKRLGCDQVRGYLFCPPVRPENATEYLSAQSAIPNQAPHSRPAQST